MLSSVDIFVVVNIFTACDLLSLIVAQSVWLIVKRECEKCLFRRVENRESYQVTSLKFTQSFLPDPSLSCFLIMTLTCATRKLLMLSFRSTSRFSRSFFFFVVPHWQNWRWTSSDSSAQTKSKFANCLLRHEMHKKASHFLETKRLRTDLKICWHLSNE